MGKVRRAPTGDELRQMQELADAAMRQGAWGMSTGLQYVPGAYADTDEIVAVASVVNKHGGIYASHMRDESDELIEAIEEVIEIARRAKLHCHISHLKSSKPRNWGKIRVATHVIEQARKDGLRITADQYPYTASSTSIMAMLLPDEEREGGEQETSERLNDPDELARVRPLVAKALEERGRIMIASFANNREWVGKMIHEVAAQQGREPVEIGLELLGDPKAQGVNFGMDEADVRFAMTLPWVATASDGGIALPEDGSVHPRYYGTFPRKIRHYALTVGALSLEAAIRSQTSLPARIMGLRDRGELREGYWADVVVFDLETIADRATFFEPHQHAEGIEHVLVNGRFVIEDGRILYSIPGRVIPSRRGGPPSVSDGG